MFFVGRRYHCCQPASQAHVLLSPWPMQLVLQDIACSLTNSAGIQFNDTIRINTSVTVSKSALQR